MLFLLIAPLFPAPVPGHAIVRFPDADIVQPLFKFILFIKLIYAEILIHFISHVNAFHYYFI